MSIGIIGAAGVAQAFAKHLVRAGYEVMLSNSRGPDSLAALVREIGPGATAGTVAESLIVTTETKRLS